ncbi:hypothetical protein C8N46_11378 [Kordia periserrulae]|uniref:Amidohydrolase n=1 Tax=Kordia periserrulae TaxID=701523 RepID=A0A2T6BRH9_9FLAO|nr:hypothetical protein [Kordia periserrulae]PTX58587.1 hypothetical protein C8N46_11378 [Kordia periserrulae]
MEKNYLEQKNESVQKKLEFSQGKNPFVYSSEKICKLQRLHIPYFDQLYERPEEINFVGISLPDIENVMEINTNGEKYPLDQAICVYNKNFSDYLLKQFKEALLHAVEVFKAHIICINELGMPLNESGEVRDAAIDFARGVANDYKCLIVAGSNHSKESFLNTGYIFYPGLDAKNLDYRKFYKNISATGVGEKLFTPSVRKIYFTNAFGIGIAFLICLEIADFSSACSIARQNGLIDFLVVPTYLEEFGTMDKVAKTISKAIGGIFLSNCHNHSDFPDSRMYLHGRPHKDNLTDYKQKIIDEKTVVILRKVDMKEFKATKSEWSVNMPDSLKFLFGPQLCEIG